VKFVATKKGKKHKFFPLPFLFCLFGIPDPGSRIRDPRSRIRDKHPGTATLPAILEHFKDGCKQHQHVGKILENLQQETSSAHAALSNIYMYLCTYRGKIVSRKFNINE
jgi:hypothetical protein